MRAEMRAFITLTTDFGTGDDEAGVLKGVIWSIAPHAHIADLTHAVTPQNIMEGALVLGRNAHYFPAGTVHVAVVDPGVGTARRGMAARFGEQYFVGPDNGLCTQMWDRALSQNEPVEFYQLENPAFWLPKVTSVFHGRDIFAPAAAHLASGIPLTAFGSPIPDPVRLEIPHPVEIASGWRARVLYVDSFGNLGTNMPGALLSGNPILRVRIAGQEIDGLVKTFGERPAGSLVALIDSSGYLSISLVNGDAAKLLRTQPGDEFEVITA